MIFKNTFFIFVNHFYRLHYHLITATFNRKRVTAKFSAEQKKRYKNEY
jgi:hypothetical protein